MSFGTRLKEKRESLGITQPQLAEMLNVSKGAIGNWETDVNSPRATLLYDLFDILHCDANYLFQDETRELYENEASPEEFENIIKKYRFISTHSPNGASVVDTVLDREYAIAQQIQEKDERIKELERGFIPKRIFAYYGKIAAAGTSVEFSGMTAGTKSYPENDINENADYVIGVSGASMEPEYYDGDIVYVQKSEHLSVGDIGIFQKANSIYIKKVGEAGLISLNPDYPGLIADGDIITVLGRVLGKAED